MKLWRSACGVAIANNRLMGVTDTEVREYIDLFVPRPVHAPASCAAVALLALNRSVDPEMRICHSHRIY